MEIKVKTILMFTTMGLESIRCDKSGGIKSGVVDKDCPTPDQNLSRTGDERDLVRFASINEALMKLLQRIVSAYTAKRIEKQILSESLIALLGYR